MTFAKRVYLVAAIYGLIVLLPQYFLEAKTERDFPPPISHPEYYYGFIGVAVAWQIAFLLIAKDPVRFRPLMIATILEKGTFGIATAALFLADRVHTQMFGAALIDLVLGALFAAAYVKTGRSSYSP
jgi:hypothetical protein